MNLRDIQNLGQPAAQLDRIVGIDQHVPVLGGTLQRYINLDNAASTPVLGEVLETVNQFMQLVLVGSPRHRIQEPRRDASLRRCARQIVAQFVGASADEHTVIFGKNTTEAINKLSYRLPLSPDDVVLVSQLEHHSNDLPWRARARVEHIGVDALGRLDEAHLDASARAARRARRGWWR